MFRILFILLALLSHPSQAQTPITKDAANAYYRNCKAQSDPRLRPETQEELCACTAVQMMEKMSVQEVQTMSHNDQSGRMALNKMLVEVYAPCINFPVQDMISEECMNDPKVDMAGLKMDKAVLCDCMGEKTGAWMASAGKALMGQILAGNPNITDPIGPVMENKAFRQQAYENMMACMSGL